MIKKFVAQDVVLINDMKFYFYSIVSYALESGDCPVEALNWFEYAKKKWPYSGHVCWWLGQCVVGISSSPRTPEPVKAVVEVGEVVQFEGRTFRVEAANNENMSLIDLGPVKFQPTTDELSGLKFDVCILDDIEFATNNKPDWSLLME